MLLEALGSTVPDVERLVAAFEQAPTNELALAQRQSARSLLSEMAARDLWFQAVVTGLLTGDGPKVAAALAKEDQDESAASPAQAAREFALCRAETLALLGGLGPGDWQRATADPAKGRRTLRFLAQDLVDADIAATNELVSISVAYRKAQQATTLAGQGSAS